LLAFKLGISLSEYNDMTPHDLFIKNRAFIELEKYEAEKLFVKLKQEQDLLTYQAFFISRWVWEKKVDINKFLNYGKTQKEMTPDEMLKAVMNLNKDFGGEVVYRGSKK
jgi:hypothetical protein